ncbi:MAG: MFS transporter [Methanocella sp.]
MRRSLLSRYDRQVWILLGGALISSFGFSIAWPFVSLYLFKYRGVSMGGVGIALLIAALVGLVGQYISGSLCDRIGRKIVMGLGLAMNTVAFGLLTVAIVLNLDYTAFVVLLCFREISGGLYRNIPNVMIADLVGPADRNGAFSLLRIGINLGFALGPLLGGIMALYSYAAMFAAATIASVVYLTITIFLLRDTKPRHPVPSKLTNDSSVWGDRQFLLFCVVTAAVSLVYSQMQTTFSTYSGSYGGIDESMIGLLFSINGIMIVLFQYPVAVFIERFKLTTSLMVGTVLYAVGFGIVGMCSGFWQLAACVFVISLGELVYSPPSINIVVRMASPESRGRYMGFACLMGKVGFALGPAIGGLLMDGLAGEISVMWFMLGGLGVACVFGFWYLRFRVYKEIDKSAGVARVYPRLHR